MRRRHFLATLGGAAVSWPYAAPAQRTPARIGFLASGAAASINSAYQIRTIKFGLGNNGLVEERDYILEPRFAAGNDERLPEMVRDLVQTGVNVVIANAIASVRAVQRLVPPLPVVMVSIDDPVGNGLVASLDRPGSHTTGIATASERLTPRMLELERSIVPNAASMAFLYNPANPPAPWFLEDLRSRARAFGISVAPIEFRSRDELEAAFGRLATKPPDLVQVMSDSGTGDFIDRIAALALMHRLPTFADTPEFATFGGLVAYGASREQLYLRTGYFVKKILDGADAGELAIEQPSRAELWINLRTAKALGLSVPASLLAAADKVLE